jgi:hypothetical protein
MTKQEAIEILTEMRDWNDYITQSDALQMAIDALEKKPAVSCEDAISRQAVKQEFAEWHKGGYEDCAFYKYLDKMPPVSVAEKTGRWIPVSERLPEHSSILASDKYENSPWVCNSFVCLTFENGIVHIYETEDGTEHLINGDIKSFLKGKKITSSSGQNYWLPPREIIAWMPLPQPYKGESEVSDETCD